MLVLSLDVILSNKSLNKDADQTAWMRRQVCAFVIRMQYLGVFFRDEANTFVFKKYILFLEFHGIMNTSDL